MQRVLDVDQIAEICHETNRAYCRTIGDESQVAFADCPEWQRASAVKGVEFHLEHLSKFPPQEPSPSASHESWLDEKERNGWKYGAVKDPEKKEHPCFLPYDELPLEQRMKDYLFGAVVKAFWDGTR